MKRIILQALYRFFQALVWVTYAVYFRRIVFINREYLKSKGPLIVVSNHPNTLMDPLMALYKMRETCYLLANYSLFKNPISNAILSTLYCIPIKRVSDVAEGQPLNNDDAFKRCDEHLQLGRNLYIAVEGASFPERRIREVKTGMARIAFSAESKNDFNLDLRILPIALTYFDGLKFRKDVVVEIGEPISVDSWKDSYHQNPRKAVNDLSLSIEQALIDKSIHCKDAEEDAFLKKLEIILQSENPLPTLEHYHRSKKVLAQLHLWHNNSDIKYTTLKNNVNTYFSQINMLGVQDCNLNKMQQQLPLSIAQLIVTSPLFLYGFINNLIPAFISNSMVKWLKIDSAYDSTIRYMGGLIFFPIFWWLQKLVFEYVFSIDSNGWLYAISCILLGIFAYNFSNKVIQIRDFWRLKNSENKKSIEILRSNCVTVLNSIKI